MNKQVLRMALCLLILMFYLHIGEVDTKGICLYVSEMKASWFDGQYECKKYGMCLAVIESAIVLRQLAADLRMENKFDDYWFGLNAVHKDNYRYVSNDKPAEFVPPRSSLVYNGSCAFLKYQESTYEFASDGCEVHKKFICAFSPSCEGHHSPTPDSCIITEEVRSIVAY